MDGRNPAPPQRPWNDDSPVNTNKPWLQPWFKSGAGFCPSTVAIQDDHAGCSSAAPKKSKLLGGALPTSHTKSTPKLGKLKNTVRTLRQTWFSCSESAPEAEALPAKDVFSLHWRKRGWLSCSKRKSPELDSFRNLPVSAHHAPRTRQELFFDLNLCFSTGPGAPEVPLLPAMLPPKK